ncbi:transglutaminase-like cysteine peptidase [Methylobrevis albus]|uniref:Transglutaminase-like cysteine peptidase n=1 Tax=Methylobrevis albus TaxID=2793297 RepID=A0A931N0A4_9HYPH|nr:transglutaminase-like cysteine peptidase [Methylobrevis albus]MBH0238974.1 transglutaminase-like cysteine peptidase [Methylobrevis albus]
MAPKQTKATWSLIAGLFLGLAAVAPAQAAGMQIVGNTSPPAGFVQFCRDNPRDCRTYGKVNQIVRLDPKTMARLNATNTSVNRTISPATDEEIYGVVEHWAYPALVGDCEDYVLLKRKLLIEDGWPASALLITVVRDEVGDGHAVLAVRTDRGDLVLDNKTDEILLWQETPYRYIKRQSARQQTAWDMIDDNRMVEVGSIRRP